MTTLKGITWDHSRGYLPVAATAQRFTEMHPDIRIQWETRSLKDFGDQPIDCLARQYDLIVMDHPWVGFAYERNLLLPLEQWLDDRYLEDQREHSVGKSFESSSWKGSQLALAVDAAAPIAFYLPEKLEEHGRAVPKTWEEMHQLAEEGLAACAGNPTSLLMQFYMHCASRTDQMFCEGRIAPREIMEESLEMIRELFSHLRPEFFRLNPIGIYEWIAKREHREAYCPFDFGYSNYSRAGYGENRIQAADVVTCGRERLRTVLGGAGLAVSADCREKEAALQYLQYTVSGEIQKTIYVENGGQPGHREAWLHEDANRMTNDFFKNTLATLDSAYLRPRYNGYLEFQEKAGVLIQEGILQNRSVCRMAQELQELYRK